MKLTQEQANAIDLFKSRRNLKINAYAGTGKTATLQLMGDCTSRKGLYLAFNNAIASGAKGKFSSNITCQTTHSLAFRSVASRYKNSDKDKLSGKLNGNAVLKILSLPNDLRIANGFSLNQPSLAFLVLQTLKKFMQSNGDSPKLHNIPLYGKMKMFEPKEIAEAQQKILTWTKKLWEKMVSAEDIAPLGHDGYLKLWSLSKPQLNIDFILLDEAQDSSPVVLNVLVNQQTQVVYVGDRYQQIYEWRGAVNAMEMIETPHTSYLTKSFRFGDTIASLSNKFLTLLGETKPLQGNPEIQSKLDCVHPETILCRTNSGVINNLLQQMSMGRKPFVVGNKSEIDWLLTDVTQLKRGIPGQHPDFFGFKNWNEVVAFSEKIEGEHLKTFVNIVQDYGEEKIKEAFLHSAENESIADITISTVHRGKGLEWDRVAVYNDFPAPKKNHSGLYELDPAELRLIYVAITRGRKELELPQNMWQYLQIHQSEIAMISDQANTDQKPAPTKWTSTPPPLAPHQEISTPKDKFTIDDVILEALLLVKNSITDKFPDGCLSQDEGIAKLKEIFPSFTDYGKLCYQLGHPLKGLGYLLSFKDIQDRYKIYGKYWILSIQGWTKLSKVNETHTSENLPFKVGIKYSLNPDIKNYFTFENDFAGGIKKTTKGDIVLFSKSDSPYPLVEENSIIYYQGQNTGGAHQELKYGNEDLMNVYKNKSDRIFLFRDLIFKGQFSIKQEPIFKDGKYMFPLSKID